MDAILLPAVVHSNFLFASVKSRGEVCAFTYIQFLRGKSSEQQIKLVGLKSTSFMALLSPVSRSLHNHCHETNLRCVAVAS